MIILLQQHRGSRATSQPRGRASQNKAWASHSGQADIRPSWRSSVPVRPRGQRGQPRATEGARRWAWWASPAAARRRRCWNPCGSGGPRAARSRSRGGRSGREIGAAAGKDADATSDIRSDAARSAPRRGRPPDSRTTRTPATPRDRVPDPLPDVNHLPPGGPAARHRAHQLAWVRGATVVGRAGCHGRLCRGLPLPQNCSFSGRVATRPVAWLRLVRGRGEEVQDQGAGVGVGFLEVGVAGVGDQVEPGARDAVGE